MSDLTRRCLAEWYRPTICAPPDAGLGRRCLLAGEAHQAKVGFGTDRQGDMLGALPFLLD